MLQRLAPDESYRSGESAFGEDHGQSLNLSHYIDILKRRIFYFLLPFGLISILGLYLAAIQKPNYLSEGKILVESQVIAADLVRPITTATASERIQLIQQRLMTRDNLLSIANKFGLSPQGSEILESMRKSTQINTQIKFGDVLEGQLRQGGPTIAFTVGFEHENPEVAMKVANEFVTLIVDADARSRANRTTEAVKLLTGETKDIESKLESTQELISEIGRRPLDEVPELPDREKSQLTALAALKAELIQKTSVYSEAHPTMIALKKRIAAMEKTLTQSAQAPVKARSTREDDLGSAKRQREVLEKRLAEANSKLYTARLSEKLDRDQQTERFQVIESPQLPLKPLKSGRLKTAGIFFAVAAMLGIGAVIATELFDGSIRNRDQLSGVVDSLLVVSIPYMTTRSDIIKARWRTILVALTVIIILTALGRLAAAILFGLPVDFSW